MVVEQRYFWRRCCALVIDLLLLGMVVTLLAGITNKAIGTNLVAPGLIKTTQCQPVELFSAEQMQTYFPLRENGSHVQVRCDTTNFFVTSYSIAQIGMDWKVGATTYRSRINYPVNKRGELVRVFQADFVLYILAPFVFAYFLSRRKATLGKSWMSVWVVDQRNGPPDFRNAFIREGVKFLPVILFGAYSLYSEITIYGPAVTSTEFIEASLKPLAEASDQLQNLSWINFTPVILFIIAMIWFFFGSFIRWNGQAYWDRVAHLYVVRQPSHP